MMVLKITVVLGLLVGLTGCTRSTTASMPENTQPPPAVVSQRPSLLPEVTATAVKIDPTETGQPPVPSATADADPDDFYGGLVVTLDQAGQTITLKPRQAFLLSLGDDYIWDVSIGQPDLLNRNRKITPLMGEQGVYVARSAGQTDLRAVGRPVCRLSQPPCSRPDVLFNVLVVIQ